VHISIQSMLFIAHHLITRILFIHFLGGRGFSIYFIRVCIDLPHPRDVRSFMLLFVIK